MKSTEGAEIADPGDTPRHACVVRVMSALRMEATPAGSRRVRSPVKLCAIWLAAGLVMGGCGGTTRFSLLPGMRNSSRDPNPTRPLVETPTAPPRNDGESRSPRSPGVIGKVDTAVSGAAVLSWLLGGAAPLVGVYGTFDETSWFGRKPAARRGTGSSDGDGDADGDRPPQTQDPPR
jgi:hypothetical protein